MTTLMSNVAIVTSLPRFQDYFSFVNNIEFFSRLMLTLPSVVIAILSPILGHIVFKIGKKNSTVIALFLFSVTGSSGLYLQNIESFLLSRAFFGIAIATLMIVSTSLVGDYFQGEARHKFMGYQSAFMAIGGVSFVLGGGFLSDLDWRFPFGIYLIGFLLIPMAVLFLEEKTNYNKDENENSNTISTNILGVYFLAFFYMLIFFILPTQMPFLIIDTFKASGKITGSIISIAFLANAFGAISFTKLKRKFQFSTIYLIALGVIATGFASVGYIDNIYLFYLSAPILGFGGGIMMTNVTAWMLSKTTFERRVKASSFLTSFLFLGQFFSPIVFHPVVIYFGVQDFFLVIGFCLYIITLTSLLIKRYQYKKILKKYNR